MRLNDMFPSKFLKAEDIPAGGLTVEIAGVEQQQLDNERKFVVAFHNHEKQLVLNKTNAKRIAHLHGDDTRQWIAQKIHLVSEAVDFRGDIVQAVRVSLNAPQPQQPAQPTEQPAGSTFGDDIPI